MSFIIFILKGIPLYVIPDNIIYDPLLLARFIKRHRITRIFFTPSLLETILDATNINMADFTSLRYQPVNSLAFPCSNTDITIHQSLDSHS